MTDSVAVWPPGFRLTDSTTGAPMSGAVVEFYDAGTTNPKSVYADSDLLTSIGTTVTTNALGYPTSDAGTTRSLVYVGTAAYKIVIKTSDNVTIATHDNVKGAVELPDSNPTVTATRPVVTKSLDYTVVAADQNGIINGNCSGNSILLTMESAVTLGNGWPLTVNHAGTANTVSIVSVSGQTFTDGAKNYGARFVLTLSGESATFVSDGGNWRVIDHTTPAIKLGQGILPILDRVSSAPGSPGCVAVSCARVPTATSSWAPTATRSVLVPKA